MPFTTQDANKHKKGMTAKQARQWTHVANSALSKCIKGGGSDETCAPKAIQYASGVIKKQQEERYQRDYGDKAREEEFIELGDDLKSYIDTAIAEFTKAEKEVIETESETMVDENNNYQECDEMKPKLTEILKSNIKEFNKPLGEFENMIRSAFRATFKPSDGDEYALWTRDVFVEHPVFGSGVAVEYEGANYLAPFEIDADGEITFAMVDTWKKIELAWRFVEEVQMLPGKTAEKETVTEPQELAEVEIKESDEQMTEIKIGEVFTGTEKKTAIIINEKEYKGVSPEKRRSTLKMEMAVIYPGFGNTKDNNYYSKELLMSEKVAKALEGVKMYPTDHKSNEYSERLEVAVIDKVSRYSPEGAPIVEVTVFDPDFAEKTRNRAEGNKLHTLECSIAASGRAVNGEVNGKKAKIVKEIDEFFSVDFVTRAGAGGKTVGLLESESKEVEPMGKKTEDGKTTEEEVEVKETEKETEDISIKEKETPETPPKLSKEKVTELINASTLPNESKERLTEMEYADEAKLKEVITKEIDYVVKLTKSGKPFESVSATNQEKEIKSHDERMQDLFERYEINVRS